MQDLSHVSPFEIKSLLLTEARKGKGEVLNAGRGNPNFLNTTVRLAFSLLNQFAAQHAEQLTEMSDLGLRLPQKGLANAMKTFLQEENHHPTFAKAASFLLAAFEYASDTLDINPDALTFEFCDDILGDFYPSPPRIQPQVERIITHYLEEVLSPVGESLPKGEFQLFATEGATMAMVYVFNSLKENFILKEGDHIAIMTPIFTPYLEIPALNDYQLKQIHIEADEEAGWQYPDAELEKLKDPKVKALFLVNPANPPGVSVEHETLKKIAAMVNEHRPDLIVLTDTVYATFVKDFRSLEFDLPRNTICVYSYSKYFGVTGWRLGVIMLHEQHLIDDMIAKLPEAKKRALAKRYESYSPEPEKMKFIDRLEVDSRDVALAHTGGLSCPQQVMMCLCSLFEMVDKKRGYRHSIHKILAHRAQLLHDGLQVTLPTGPHYTYYYVLLDLKQVCAEKYNHDFAEYFDKNINVTDFLFKLAKEKQTVCLPGGGFAGPKSSIRLSLANLPDEDYLTIGKNLHVVLDGYYQAWSH